MAHVSPVKVEKELPDSPTLERVPGSRPDPQAGQA
jgi:hypothetical protein